MTLTASERSFIQSLWVKIAPQANTLGAEALERMFLSFPLTKNNFSNFDVSHGSVYLLNHGGKLINALGDAASHLDNLADALSTLTNLHFRNLKVDSGNFELLSHTIQVTLAVHFPTDFTAECQAAWDKFLSEVFEILTSKHN